MAIRRVDRVHLALHMAWVRRGYPPRWACRLLRRLGSTYSCEAALAESPPPEPVRRVSRLSFTAEALKNAAVRPPGWHWRRGAKADLLQAQRDIEARDELTPPERQALEANAAARRDRELRAILADEARDAFE